MIRIFILKNTILFHIRINSSNSLALPIISKYIYIIDVLYYSNEIMGNNTRFKQILVDLDNYNALKDLGKAGDSFNDVVRALLTKTNATKDLSLEELNIENVIEINP